MPTLDATPMLQARTADAGIAEVLRLIRVSLVLRIVPSFIFAFGSLFSGASSIVTIAAVFLQPSLILFIVASMWARKGNIQARPVRILLALMIVFYALEFIPRPALSLIAGNVAWLQFGPPITPTELQQIGTSAPIPLFFSLIPTVLGAWIDGQRGWWGWAVGMIAVMLIGVLALTNMLPNATLSIFGFMAIALVTLVVCYFVGSLADQQRAEHAALEQANRKLAEQAFVREQLATTRERMRLSRDLHDTVAHKLAALAVQVNAIDAVLRSPKPSAPEIVQLEVDRARELVKEGLEETRRAIGGLRANQVEDLGLAGALAKLADTITQRGSFDATFERKGDDPVLPADSASALYFITQEALNNAERHAEAQHVVITFDGGTSQDPFVTVRVADDGIGFDAASIAAKVGQRDEQPSHFGLTGMRERAEMIGAHLRVDSHIGIGTTVTVTVTVSLRY